MSKEKLSRLTNSHREIATDLRETKVDLAAIAADLATSKAAEAEARAKAEIDARIEAAVAAAVVEATKPKPKTADDIIAQTRLGTAEHAVAVFEKYPDAFRGRDGQ